MLYSSHYVKLLIENVDTSSVHLLITGDFIINLRDAFVMMIVGDI